MLPKDWTLQESGNCLHIEWQSLGTHILFLFYKHYAIFVYFKYMVLMEVNEVSQNLESQVRNYSTQFWIVINLLSKWITHLEPDILECEVKWALGSITTSKASGGDGIPVELFQILKDDAVKVLHSVCQKIWKTQQWPQDWKMSVYILIPKKGNGQKKTFKLSHNCTHLTR